MSKTESQKIVEIAEKVYKQALRLNAFVGTLEYPYEEGEQSIKQLIDVSNALHKTAAEYRTGELTYSEFEVLFELMKD